MKYNDKYDILDKYVGSGCINWEITGSGEMVIGTYNGKKWFIKRRMDVLYPPSTMPADLRELLLEEIQPIEHKQRILKEKMKDLDVDRDHIVKEEEHIEGDIDNKHVTVTRLIEGVLPEDSDLSTLTKEQLINLFKDSATLIKMIGDRGIIHSDLKPKNFVIKKDGTTYIPYLIDFDLSYPEDEIPKLIPGSPGYFSPETLAINDLVNNEKEADYSIITKKLDVFVLAIVIHMYWTNVFPTYDTSCESVGDAVNKGKNIAISSKFNVIIGDTYKATLKSLLNWMFERDVTKRPSIENVLDVLNDLAPVPSDYHVGDDASLINTSLWPIHILLVKPFTKSDLEKKDIVEFNATSFMKGEEKIKVYAVKIKGDSTYYNLTVEELFEKGILEKNELKYDEPFEENVELLPQEELYKMGIISIERYIEPITNKKRYRITQGNMMYDKSITSLINLGMAKYKEDYHEPTLELDSASFDEPWDDSIIYNPDRFKLKTSRQLVSLKKTTEGKYKLTYNDGLDVEIDSEQVIKLGYFKRK